MCSNTSEGIIIAHFSISVVTSLVWIIFISIVLYKNRDSHENNNEINQATVPSIPVNMNNLP